MATSVMGVHQLTPMRMQGLETPEGIWSPTPRILSPSGRGDGGRHVRMCRYDDASGLFWSNFRFESDGSGFEITFDKRKNAQFRQDNKVLVASSPLAVVCLVRLPRKLQISTGGAVDLYALRGFNCKMVAKNLRDTAPGPKKILYD